jgi:hypothetical protein
MGTSGGGVLTEAHPRLTRQYAVCFSPRLANCTNYTRLMTILEELGPAIEVWLTLRSVTITCKIVCEDESIREYPIKSLSMRGAEREITGFLINAVYEPTDRWSYERGQAIANYSTKWDGSLPARIPEAVRHLSRRACRGTPRPFARSSQ